jgi:DNA-binding NtrC family response regulator
MKTAKRLTDADRTFLGLVAQATAANPFTEQRARLDAQLLGKDFDERQVWNPEPSVEVVHARVRQLVDAGAANLSSYRTGDRERVRIGALYHLFHVYRDALDAHIEAQLLAGRDPLPVAFAGDCLARMAAFGLEREDALRAFASFFQLRRAFYFIHSTLVGRGRSMQRLRAQLWNNVFTHDFLRYERILWNRLEDFSTLLLGETGTGKGAAAAAIGRSAFIPFDPRSGRFAHSFTETFLSVNLSQFSESLIESELFGHRKGAFTGAVSDHIGLLARCQPTGTIFLDEIGDLAAPVQLKLLRVLQERTFCPVGSHEERRFAGRVVAATNRPMAELRGSGRFRDDFFYRLCSDVIQVPAWRQRLQEEPAEFAEMLGHILKRISGDPGLALAGEVERAVRASVPSDYGWPGNVRELEQAVRSVLLNGQYTPHPVVGASDVGDAAAGLARDLTAGTMTAQRLLARYCRLLHARSENYGDVARRTGLDRRTVRKYVLAEDRQMENARRQSDGLTD